MAFIFMEKGGICLLAGSKLVIWKTPASGDKFGPYKRPADFMDLVLFCSDWDYYAEHSRTLVSLTHQNVPGLTVTDGLGFGGGAAVYVGQTLQEQQVLVTHNLGYPPRFWIAQDDRVLPSGMNVQNLSDRARFMSFYATATQIVAVNIGTSSSVALPAFTASYDTVVFKRVAAADVLPGLPLFWAKRARAIMGRGKIDTDIKTVRIGAGTDTPFYIPLGRNVDLNAGASRVVLPNGPTITQAGYAGSFTGSPSLRVFA